VQTEVLMDAFQEVGLSPGVINLVTGLDKVVGTELTQSPDIQETAFSSSTQSGKLVAKNSLDTMKHLTLEVGASPLRRASRLLSCESRGGTPIATVRLPVERHPLLQEYDFERASLWIALLGIRVDALESRRSYAEREGRNPASAKGD
jgi:aldehyde dehydrogenase family protein